MWILILTIFNVYGPGVNMTTNFLLPSQQACLVQAQKTFTNPNPEGLQFSVQCVKSNP